jgi:hypothetical protein
MAQADTSIYSNALSRMKSVADYDNEYAQQEGNKLALQRNALALKSGEMDMQGRQRAMQEQAAFRNALATFDPKNPQSMNALMQASPELAQKFRADQLGMQKTEADVNYKNAQADKERLAAGLQKFEIIGQLMGGVRDQATYDQARQAAAQEFGPEFAAKIPPVYDPQAIEQNKAQAMSVKARMEQEWKAKGYDLDVRKADESARHNQAAEGLSRGNLSVAQQRLALEQTQPKGTYDAARGVIVDTRSGTASPVKMPGGAPLPAAKAVNMSATMQKEVFEADDTVQSGKAVINILDQAAKLNDTAYSGYLAKPRAVLRSNLPGQSAGADATINLDNMMTGQALESLKLVFGGMPTEGERKILLDMQASADKTPGQRKDIINRAIKAAKTRVAFNEKKGKALREGTYMTEGVQNDPIQPDAPAAAPAGGAKFLGFE